MSTLPIPKRRPTLADEFISTQNMPRNREYRKFHDQLKPLVRQSHKFIFDDEASLRVARVIQDIPELIVREYQFARAPYDLTWIEYQSAPFFDQLNSTNSEDPYEPHDVNVAYLVNGNAICVFARGKPTKSGPSVIALPIVYFINTEWPSDSDSWLNDPTDGRAKVGIDKIFWGSSYSSVPPSLQSYLRENSYIQIIPFPSLDMDFEAVIRGTAGDLRNIIAFLLMLNRPSITSYRQTIPNSKHFASGKLVTFLSYTEVEVSLDAKRTLKLMSTPAESGIHKRRHEVAGHYCHDQTARDYMRIAGCMHQWAASDEPDDQDSFGPIRWTCSSCGGKRWWRRSHERGDASIGYVVKRPYQVGA